MKLSEYRALKSKKRTKFGAVACKRDGIRFHSKLERAYYDHLVYLHSQQEIWFFLRQVPFHLTGCKYVVDFVVFDHKGIAKFIDVKGRATEVYKLKLKMLCELYPGVEIIEVRKGDF